MMALIKYFLWKRGENISMILSTYRKLLSDRGCFAVEGVPSPRFNLKVRPLWWGVVSFQNIIPFGEKHTIFFSAAAASIWSVSKSKERRALLSNTRKRLPMTTVVIHGHAACFSQFISRSIRWDIHTSRGVFTLIPSFFCPLPAAFEKSKNKIKIRNNL